MGKGYKHLTRYDRVTIETMYIQDWINDYPRKMFNWRTSRELFTEQLHALKIYDSPI